MLGPLPQGLRRSPCPGPARRPRQVVIGGCAVAMVSFADTSVLSPICGPDSHAGRSDQEMIGLGAAT